MEPTSLPDETVYTVDQSLGDISEIQQPLIRRRFTSAGEDPFETVEWERRDAIAGDFFQPNVEVPKDWTDDSIGVVAKLYFATVDGVREDSVRQMVHRVAEKITNEGLRHGHFDTELDDDASIFYDELVYICLHQMAGFNTPTWLNIGVSGRKQCGHACYPLSVQDHMLGEDGIVDWWRKEAIIFKSGGGAGINLSNLRGSMETLSTGGKASGPIPYMRAANAAAETLKSGGAHRRAAKFLCLDDDHPDLLEWIECKPREDKVMQTLMEAGHDLSIFTPEGERNVAEVTSFQSGNISVSASDKFMRAVEDDADWNLTARTTGNVVSTHKARDIMRKIAEAAWQCADPGMIFIDTINRYHTTPSVGPITTVNTCFVGETLVDTSEGKVRIDALAEAWATGQPLPYAFGFDQETSMPALKRIQRAMVIEMATELVRVTTDKGVVFECTPEHKILCRQHHRSSDSYYVQAGDLKPGQSLRKVGRYISTKRSDRKVLTHRVTEEAPNGCSWQSIFMWEQAYGPIPEGMEVHHINEDPTDDRLSNLELVDSGTHQSFHSTGLRNGRAIDTDTATLVEVYDYATGRPGRKNTEYVAYATWKWAVDQLGLAGKVARGNSKGIRGLSWPEFGRWIESQRELVNDKVALVERITFKEPVPVYDITVEGIHNFGVCTEGIDHSIVVANCGEICQNDDTACNLAALNVLKFLKTGVDFGEPGVAAVGFDTDDFCHVVDVMMTAMDIVNGFSELPTDRITERTRALRQCGLGFTNLGAAIMAQGMPYDSDDARDFASSVAALLTGRAYAHSAVMAEKLGAFDLFEDNRDFMMGVVSQQKRQLPGYPSGIWNRARLSWDQALIGGSEQGFRNSQVTAMMPTGTVSFLLGADTTGMEPAFSLVTYKQLAAAGKMKMVNQSARLGAQALGGYSDDSLLAMAGGDFSCIAPEDLPTFATAVGENSIAAMGHLRMVEEIQRFTTQAISKTMNLPNSATVEDIMELYMEAWRRGCKTISVYRDGSKATQVLSAAPKNDKLPVWDQPPESTPLEDATAVRGLDIEAATSRSAPQRRRLPRTRASRTHKIHIRSPMGEHEGYISAGMYPDGTLGEVFMEGFGRMGGFVQNVLSAWSTDFSIALQYGVPFDVLVRKHVGHSDETGGVVVPGQDDDTPLVIRSCDSIVDYIARWLVSEFGDVDLQEELGVMTDAVKARKMAPYISGSEIEEVALPAEVKVPLPLETYLGEAGAEAYRRERVTGLANSNGHARETIISAQPCPACYTPMQRTGTCLTCPSCGHSSGGCG